MEKASLELHRLQHRQVHWSIGIASEFWWQNGVSVFPKLFGRFEILIVHTIVSKLAVVSAVLTTDRRTRVVGTAAIVRLQMLAVSRDQQEPGRSINKDGIRPMHHVPAHVVKLLPRLWSINAHRKVSAAARRTIAAENLTDFEVFAD